jgi:hypothetical protein
VNIVRDIEKIFEFSVDINDVSEWINLYVPIYYSASVVNSADNIIFEKKYSIPAERAARKIVIKKSEKLKKRKKRSKIS